MAKILPRIFCSSASVQIARIMRGKIYRRGAAARVLISSLFPRSLNARHVTRRDTYRATFIKNPTVRAIFPGVLSFDGFNASILRYVTMMKSTVEHVTSRMRERMQRE